MKKSQLRQDALNYHRHPTPGKIGIISTKPTETQEHLSLCYTPGVAEPVREIADDASKAYDYTSKGNLVAVITNGTAVLGLGNVGALASKPVMEGKAVLFKRYADIDVFDIEIDCADPTDFIETVVRIAPTFGGINLEDIKAPECFVIENALRERLSIPVMHDDQHGTAIVVAAGLLNALELQKKTLSSVNIVCLGAGAAGMATMELLVSLGALRENIDMIDRTGVIHQDRSDLNEYKAVWAKRTDKRTLSDAMQGADVLIGVSGPDLVTPEMITSMAPNPIVFALSNPVPEIDPAAILAARKDCIIATGRSDYPNQVNNALCFPYLFRGALDARAASITDAMKMAAVQAIRLLAQEDVPEVVLTAYGLSSLAFGPQSILPKLLDPRLKERVSSAVRYAAMQQSK